MSEEENKPKRTVKITLDRKFGVSEAPERRPRRSDDDRGSFGDKSSSRGERRFDRDRGDRRFDRDDRRFDRGERRFDRDRDDNREDRPFNRDERRGGGRFDRDRRPRRFGDKPFNRGPRREGAMNAPVYRQRPEQKDPVDENLDEAALGLTKPLPIRLGSGSLSHALLKRVANAKAASLAKAFMLSKNS